MKGSTGSPRTYGGRFVILALAAALALTGCETVENLVGLRGEMPEPDEAPTEASTAPPAPANATIAGRSAVLLPQPDAQSASAPTRTPAASATPSPVQPAPLVPPPATASFLTPPPASATAAVQAPPPAASDATGNEPTEEETLSFYQDVMLTYAFDACGLPLLGSISRQDISHRLDVCPAPSARKEALRLILQRAIADAERDPEKTRAAALAVCADKRAFLRNVMQHANQLTFDENTAPNCTLITPPTETPRP